MQDKKPGSVFLALGGDEETQKRIIEIVKNTRALIAGVAVREKEHFTPCADYMICCQYDKIFTREEMSLYKKSYNIHFAMLPLN